MFRCSSFGEFPLGGVPKVLRDVSFGELSFEELLAFVFREDVREEEGLTRPVSALVCKEGLWPLDFL